MKIVRLLLSLSCGVAVAVTIAATATLTARILWPAYAAAAPHKHYTLTMLIARLSVGAVSVAAAACAAIAIANDRRAAWYLGGLFLLASIPSHLYPGYSLNDYPTWYHAIYLAYLLPVAVAATFTRKKTP